MAATTVLVTHLTGQAWIRAADGTLTPIREGMRIPSDAEVVTASGASVQVQADGMPPVTIGEGQDVALTADLISPPQPSEAAINTPDDVTVDRVIAAINAGQDPLAQLDPTAATQSGGGSDGSHSFVRLASVLELTSPLALGYPLPTTTDPDIMLGGTEPGSDADNHTGTDTSTEPPAQSSHASVILTSDQSIAEGGHITVTATVGSPVSGEPLVITLNNGATITIPVGETSGSVGIPTRVDDVYVQGEQFVEFTIADTTGGAYDTLDTSSSTMTIVVDDEDATRVTVVADPAHEGDPSVTFHFALSNPPQDGHPAKLVVDVAGILHIVVLDADGKGTLSVPNPNGEDVYTDPSTLTATVLAVNGGNFEAVDLSGASATAAIGDTINTTEFALTATTGGDGSVTYTVTLSNADGLPVNLHSGLDVTLSNGQVVSVAAGAVSGSVTVAPEASDGVSVTGVAYPNDGLQFEAMSFGSVDSGTPVLPPDSITLASDGHVTEGEQITVTATVTSPVTGEPLVITLSNGATITIPVGETSGSVDVPTRPDDAYIQGDQSVEFTIAGTTGGGYDTLDTSSSTTTVVVDDADTTHVTVTADPANEGDANVTFHFQSSNPPQDGHPATLTVRVGDTDYTVVLDADGKGTLSVPNPNGEDVYTDPSTLTATVTAIDGGNFEAVDLSGASATAAIGDTINTTEFALTTDVSGVAESGGFVTYTVTLGNGDGLEVNGHSGLDITLSNGQVVHIGAGEISGSVRAYTEADTAVGITGVSYPDGGKQFEDMHFGSVEVGHIPGTFVSDPNTPGEVIGGHGDDVLVGDSGGAVVTIEPAVNYNVALLVDRSGSMDKLAGTDGLSRMDLTIEALKNLADSLAGHDGVINVTLIQFNSVATTMLTLNELTSGNVDSLKAKIESLSSYGATNYEAAFDTALGWFNGQADAGYDADHGYQNVTYFLSDGDPTVNNANTSGTANTTNVADMQRAMDVFSELSGISAVHAIGLGDDINYSQLQFFDNTYAVGTADVALVDGSVTGPIGEPVMVHTGAELNAALQESVSTVHPLPLSNDTLIGGDGDDIIFGDAINTDGSALDWASVGGRPSDLPDGSGMVALEKFIELQNGGVPATAEQIYDYLRAHHAELAPVTDTRGGDDVLVGGAGDDILYGQGGNDTFVWNSGDQGTVDRPAHDTVMDFGNDDNGGPGHVDKLDLSDLLQGEENSGDLSQYLHFAHDGADTVVKVSSTGHLATDGSGYDQLITLHGVDLAASVAGGSYDDQNGLIQKLIDAGKLAVDHH